MRLLSGSGAILFGTRLLLSTSERFAPHLLNSGRDQSDRSDFALTKTSDETGQRATPIFIIVFARLYAEWEFYGKSSMCSVFVRFSIV